MEEDAKPALSVVSPISRHVRPSSNRSTYGEPLAVGKSHSEACPAFSQRNVKNPIKILQVEVFVRREVLSKPRAEVSGAAREGAGRPKQLENGKTSGSATSRPGRQVEFCSFAGGVAEASWRDPQNLQTNLQKDET